MHREFKYLNWATYPKQLVLKKVSQQSKSILRQCIHAIFCLSKASELNFNILNCLVSSCMLVVDQLSMVVQESSTMTELKALTLFPLIYFFFTIFTLVAPPNGVPQSQTLNTIPSRTTKFLSSFCIFLSLLASLFLIFLLIILTKMTIILSVYIFVPYCK